MAEKEEVDIIAGVMAVLKFVGGGTVVAGFICTVWSSLNKTRHKQLVEECAGWRGLYNVTKAEGELMSKKIVDLQEALTQRELHLVEVQKNLNKALADERASDHRARNAEHELRIFKESK